MNAHNPDRATRTFQTSDGVALALPAALGIAPGVVMTVRRDDEGRLIVEEVTDAVEEAAAATRKINLLKLWGSCPDLKLLTREDREFDPSPRVWDDPDWPGWANDPSAWNSFSMRTASSCS